MLLRYALKSTKVMTQFGAAGVISLVAVSLLFSTVFRWRYESTLRDALRFGATGEGDALQALEDAVAMRPDDPFPTILLGQWHLERGQKELSHLDPTSTGTARENVIGSARKHLASASKAFDGALKKGKDSPNASDADLATALAGAVAARLTLGDCTPEQRGALVDEASKLLETATSDDPDVISIRAGLALAKGDTGAAQKAIAEMGNKLGQGSRIAVASYYWNHGLAMLLARDPGCAEEIERGALMWRNPESGRALALAIRVVCSDPAVPSKSPEALAARCDMCSQILRYTTRAQGIGAKPTQRFFIEPEDMARTYNQIGIGYFRANEFRRAIEAFNHAEGNTPTAVVKINEGLATNAFGEHPPETEKEPEKFRLAKRGAYATLVRDAAMTYYKNPDKEKEGMDLLLQSASIQWSAFNPVAAGNEVENAKTKFHLSEADYYRWAGACTDWEGRLDLAVVGYRKAIELRHKDSMKMDSRVQLFDTQRKQR
jgi:tetratricopeptide (TPR) repeat protein